MSAVSAQHLLNGARGVARAAASGRARFAQAELPLGLHAQWASECSQTARAARLQLVLHLSCWQVTIDWSFSLLGQLVAVCHAVIGASRVLHECGARVAQLCHEKHNCSEKLALEWGEERKHLTRSRRNSSLPMTKSSARASVSPLPKQACCAEPASQPGREPSSFPCSATAACFQCLGESRKRLDSQPRRDIHSRPRAASSTHPRGPLERARP